MTERKTYVGQGERATTRAYKALQIRIAGNSYRVIAAMLDCSVSTAYGYVRKELAKVAKMCQEQAEELRMIECHRLDEALNHLRSSEAYKSGDPQTINTYIRLSESRRKLLGLDAPIRQELSVPEGLDIRHTIADEPTPDEWERQFSKHADPPKE